MKKFLTSGIPLAKALGLPTEGLRSFDLMVEPDCPPIVQAIYFIGFSEEGDERTVFKKFRLMEEESE